MPDTFLFVRRGRTGEVVRGSFADITRDLGPLRCVLAWTEWHTVDGDLSILRLVDSEADRPTVELLDEDQLSAVAA